MADLEKIAREIVRSLSNPDDGPALEAAILSALRSVASEEREACAKVAETDTGLWAPEHGGHHPIDGGRRMERDRITYAIRNRP